MVPMECGISQQKNMVSFRGCLILGGREQIWFASPSWDPMTSHHFPIASWVFSHHFPMAWKKSWLKPENDGKMMGKPLILSWFLVKLGEAPPSPIVQHQGSEMNRTSMAHGRGRTWLEALSLRHRDARRFRWLWLEVSIVMGVPQWLVYKFWWYGKSQEMDENWSYPQFWETSISWGQSCGYIVQKWHCSTSAGGWNRRGRGPWLLRKPLGLSPMGRPKKCINFPTTFV